MESGQRYSRRRFLRSVALAGATGMAAPYVVPARVLGRDGEVPPSETIALGAIGLGFAWQAGMAFKGVRMLAVCDVQRSRLNSAKAQVDKHYGNRDCEEHGDFREVVDRRDIDAVYIATPDHWHAPITIAAARAGKHIYCQKPLTHTVAEGRAVVQAVNRYDTANYWSGPSGISPAKVREIHGEASGRHSFGVRFEGTEGSVFVWREGRLETEPKSLRSVVDRDMPATAREHGTPGHFGNWFDCIRSGNRTNAAVEVAHRSTTLCNIGTIGMSLGRDLQWDAEAERFVGDDDANRMLSYAMRDPWRL